MKHFSNAAEKALRAIDADKVPHKALREILANLRHYADTHGLDYARCDAEAYEIYLGELGWTRANPMESRPSIKESGL